MSSDSISREEIRTQASIAIQLIQLFMSKLEKEPVNYAECKILMENLCTILEKIQHGSHLENLSTDSRRMRPRKKK